MPPKPVDKRRPEESREALWALIRELRSFTLHQLWEQTRRDKNTIREYLQGLARAGYLAAEEIPSGTCRPALHYSLVNDPGAEAPRVRRDGSAVTQGQGRLQMWRAMRVLGSFTPADLAVHASLEEHAVAPVEARDYCIFLARAGYLIRLPQGAFRFATGRYSGPKPPQIQRVKQVFDPNLGKVVWSQGGDHDAD